jgi:hypothetical protein
MLALLVGCGILPAETVNPLKMLATRNSLYILLGVAFSGVYAMYFAACMRYQKHGRGLHSSTFQLNLNPF